MADRLEVSRLGEPSIVPAALILTVLNESATMPTFLRSLSEQSSLPQEVVVVDGGSKDDTVEQLRRWEVPHGVSLTVVESPGANIAQGRNLAISTATSDHILVTDGGTKLDPGWVDALFEPFRAAQPPFVVSGFFRPTGNTLIERTIAVTATPRRTEIDSADFLPSSRSVAFTRAAWHAAGGYPEWLDYCEDLVFDLRLRRLGSPFVFAPAAVVTWSARASVRGFSRQYYNYARGDGKAGLWPKRHLARYLAYAVGIGLAAGAVRHPLLLVPLAIGSASYLRKFWSRVWSERHQFGSLSTVALLLVPVVVVAGDVGKMAGYPAGLRWRARNRSTATSRDRSSSSALGTSAGGPTAS